MNRYKFPGLVRTKGEVEELLDLIFPKALGNTWSYRGTCLEATVARMDLDDGLRQLIEWLLGHPKIYKRARLHLSHGITNRYAKLHDYWRDCFGYAYSREKEAKAKAESVLPDSPINTPTPTMPNAPKPPSLAELKRQATALMDGPLQYFIGRRQMGIVRTCMRGEEARFFAEKMIELGALIACMPQTGEQDGLGENAMVHLHYFAGGAANAWITEKDMGDGTADLRQHQAFGLANLFGGPTDQDAELGYISIDEWISSGSELDFHFKPRTLAELTNRKPAGNVITPPSSPDPEIEADAARHESAPTISTSARNRLASF